MITITELEICEVLEKIGLKKSDTVLVHSSIGLMFGMQNDSAKLLYSALRKVLSDSGTVIAPTFTFSSCNGDIFDTKDSKSEVGEFSNYILSLEDSHRSIHPIHSVAAVGPNAEYVTSHESLSSFGKKSSYNKIIELKAYVLLVGAGINYLSLIHQVEEDLTVPYRFYKEFNIKVKTETGHKNVKVPYYARYLDKKIEYDYETRETTLIKSNALATVKLGWGNIKHGRSDQIYRVLYDNVYNDPLFLIKKDIYSEK